jgi:hypothetical protein
MSAGCLHLSGTLQRSYIFPLWLRRDEDMPLQAVWTHQCLIKHIRPVDRCNDIVTFMSSFIPSISVRFCETTLSVTRFASEKEPRVLITRETISLKKMKGGVA